MTEQFVVFRLDGRDYGASIEIVQEIVNPLPVTPMPNTPASVIGVVSLRGDVIPVVDMRDRLGLEPREDDDDTRIMILDLTGHPAGVRVDGVAEVIKLPADAVVPPDSRFTAPGQDYVRGVARVDDRLVIVVDLVQLILSPVAV